MTASDRVLEAADRLAEDDLAVLLPKATLDDVWLLIEHARGNL